MDKKAIIQELRDWNNAVLFAQARSFLEPFGLTIRFDADVFDETSGWLPIASPCIREAASSKRRFSTGSITMS